MKVNETNKKLYEMAFIENGEYGYHGNNWNPSIDEREIETHCEDEEGHWIPATPLGYRDYTISREQGLKNIFDQHPSIDLTNDRFHKIEKDSDIIKQYDKIKTDKGEFIVVGDDDDMYYVVDKDNKLYCVNYAKFKNE